MHLLIQSNSDYDHLSLHIVSVAVDSPSSMTDLSSDPEVSVTAVPTLKRLHIQNRNNKLLSNKKKSPSFSPRVC